MKGEKFLNSRGGLSPQTTSGLGNRARAESTHPGKELGKLRQQKGKIELFIE
jgi:hypothetical protein